MGREVRDLHADDEEGAMGAIECLYLSPLVIDGALPALADIGGDF